MRVLTAAEARNLDRWAIERLGIPSLVLMENAAIALADAVGERFPAVRRVAIFCGPGNNGGDGLALGRQLATRDYDVELLLAAFGRPLANDCSRQLETCQAIGLDLVDLGGDWRPAVANALSADLVVDALFGTGLSRALEAPWSELVEAMGATGAPILAVDLPSGLDASSAHPPGVALRATLSVTFGAARIAHLLPPAADFVGEVAVADLGVPFELSPCAEGDLYLREGRELARHVAPREADAHKGDFGSVLLVAGSRGMAGAAILAARAALVSGAGRVTIATVAELADALLAAVPEAMLLPLPGSPAGALAAEAVAPLLAALPRFDTLCIGPGLGGEAGTSHLVREAIAAFPGPAVVDADGLNAFAGNAQVLLPRRAPIVLTPHPGELGRLLALSTAEIQGDRLAAVRRAAEVTGAVVVLKGHRTLVARPGGEVGIHAVGNPGMASAGAGDVLTGVLAARLAQGDEAAIAADLAVHLHGTAGDLAAAGGWSPAIPAGELIRHLPRAFQELEQE